MRAKVQQYIANLPNDLAAMGIVLGIASLLSYLDNPNKSFFLILALLGLLLALGTFLFLIKKATSPWQLLINLITGLGLASLFAASVAPGTNRSGALFVGAMVLLVLAWGIKIRKLT